ncbi:transposase [Aeromonas salmonicida subsp. salmonicida]|uniref:Heteromeric transposase endonuclease subunit TnsA n=2 Tax=Aeromonas salmonicida subsp. salmonicida TaxID=29491 RepID=A4SJU6_AERS4|nr:heteromeric transposase endonuclease subunit TnsA [Aeromonas salmonicida]ABO89168.1 conserved hypothetical protein [Aeromonas salmonicida subsp. salmonicida A449]AYO62286.1 heteromeric transposase endonuclease subunit TnsA [Aeromonas salmonicida subsp. salmonicida 01-B526]EHI51630.1 hypothetical protein IYQ_15278 [Aeromonas salmonicida subsp. salmonicida 01-B526]EKP0241277.1 heteromeric transposase endonuclease subunit TnsA [Aeromonas salmonicida]EKP0245420.1 heteromeric transposase endonuc
MPVRKIPKNYRNVTGVASHHKSTGQAMFESTLERDFFTLLEFDPAVESFEVQPVTVHWFDALDKERIYTPDVLAYFHSPYHPTTLYEVKYRSELKELWPELKPKFRAALRFARSKGWRFKLITETEVREVRLKNAKFLLPFVKKGPVAEVDMDILEEAIQILNQSTPKDLLAHIYQDEWNRARLMPTLWYLIGTRQIATDLDQPLTMSSTIWSLNP